MTLWASGDSLTPSTLNRKLSSAASSGGFSTNTLVPESGSYISLATVRPLKVRDSAAATQPLLAPDSETSLGFYRSAASTLALSYGTFAASGVSATNLRSSTASFGGTVDVHSLLQMDSNGAILDWRDSGAGIDLVGLNPNLPSVGSCLAFQDRQTGNLPVMAYFQTGVGFVVGKGLTAGSNASQGFLYLPSSTSTGPVTAPNAAQASEVAMVFEPQHNRLWAYYSGAWHFCTFT